MTPENTLSRSSRSWPWWRLLLTALSALALALSAYLSWHYLAGGSLPGCGGGSPCDQVLSSRWSSIGGMAPVSGLAAGAYLALLIATFFIGPETAAPDRRLAWGAMLILAGAAAGSAVWFTIVQKWIIQAFCPYCMVTHITGLLLAALVTWRALLQFDCVSTGVTQANPSPAPDATAPLAAANITTDATITMPPCASSSAPQRLLRPGPVIGLPMVGLILAGIMAASQIGLKPSAAYREGESHSFATVFDPRTVPLIGSPDAPYVVSVFFDYKCTHCQQLHTLLDEAIRRYDGTLAFVLCPAPLNSQCNPYIARDLAQFADSCDLVRVGLAVWVARREAFADFDNWMFSTEPDQRWRPRSLDAATAKAVELVGQAQFDAARADPWIESHLQTCVRIFGDTIQGGNAVPKMAFGTRWVIPQPENADELVQILQETLAVPKP